MRTGTKVREETGHETAISKHEERRDPDQRSADPETREGLRIGADRLVSRFGRNRKNAGRILRKKSRPKSDFPPGSGQTGPE